MLHVKCYQCGLWYMPTEAESARHCKHGGDSGADRLRLLALIDAVQAERDEWFRKAQILTERQQQQ